MKRVIFSLFVALAAIGVASTVCAETISYTTTTPIAAATTDWSGVLLLQQFDSSLGTLTSVTLNVGSTIDTILTITNGSPSASSGSAKTEVEVRVQDAGNYLASPALDILSPKFDYSLNAGESATSGLLTKSVTEGNSYTASNILAEFTGTGTISLAASTFTQTNLSNTGGNTSASQTTHASATAQVIYTYTKPAPPVPEPSTLVLLGVASALGLLVWRKR